MKRILLCAALLCCTFLAKAQVPAELPIDPNIRYGKLDNGLTYYIRHNAYPENRADFYIAQRVGSMQEEDSQMGLAHFLEHMAFNGTKNFPGRKNMLDYLETIGAKFGANVNAYTSFDETVYNLSDIPVRREGIIDSCLLILHDWSGFITLEDAEIDKERLIIKEEWRTRGNAQQRLWEQQLPILFKGSKYANRLPIGTMDVVENFEYQTLRDYYHKWYRPDLQAIIIVGDIDAEQVENKIKAMFADIPKPENAAERIYYPVPDNQEPLITVASDKEATRTTVLLFQKHDVLPPQIKKSEMGYMIDILKNLASEMLSARLAEITQTANSPFAMAYAYDSEYFVSKTKDAWTAYAISKDGKAEESLAILVRENERAKRFGFTESEVERAKASLATQYENAYSNRNKQQNDSYVREYIKSFSNDDPIPGIEFEYNFYKKIAPMIDAAAVNQFLKQILPETNVTIAISGPEKEGVKYPTETEVTAIYKLVIAEKIEAYTETVSNEPLITTMPKAGKVVKEETNEKLGSTLWTLSNGMKVAYKHTDFKDDEVLMNAIGYGGESIVDDADIFHAQLAMLVPHLGGLSNFSSTDLKKMLAGKNASVSTGVNKWTQELKGSSSKKDLETLLQLTYLHMTAPRKDADAFFARLDFIKDQLRNQRNNPTSSMNDTIADLLYPNNERARMLKLEDAEAINYDRLIEVYKQLFANPGSFTFSFVGSIEPEVLKPLVEQYLGSLPAGNKKAIYVNRNFEKQNGKHKNVFNKQMTTPKATSFSVYKATIDRNVKNNIAISALKQVLDIVYVRTVREEEGGTYGVGSWATINRMPKNEATIQMSFDSDPAAMEKLHGIIERELKSIAENGPNDEDFQKVKEYMQKKNQEDVKENSYWLGTISILNFYKEDKHSSYLDALQATSKADVQNIAKQLLNAGNVIEVIMMPE